MAIVNGRVGSGSDRGERLAPHSGRRCSRLGQDLSVEGATVSVMQSTFFLPIMLAVCLFTPCLVRAEFPKPENATIDALVKDAKKSWRVPGVAVAIVRDGKLIYL